MPVIQKMDKVAAKALTEAVRKALEAVAREYGVTVQIGGGKYDPEAGTLTPKLTLTVAPADGTPAGREAADFRRYAEMGLIEGGFRPEHLGQVFESRQGAFKVVGYNPRRRQSILAEKAAPGGQRYWFEPRAVARLLKIEAPVGEAPLPVSGLTLVDPPGGK